MRTVPVSKRGLLSTEVGRGAKKTDVLSYFWVAESESDCCSCVNPICDASTGHCCPARHTEIVFMMRCLINRTPALSSLSGVLSRCGDGRKRKTGRRRGRYLLSSDMSASINPTRRDRYSSGSNLALILIVYNKLRDAMQERQKQHHAYL